MAASVPNGVACPLDLTRTTTGTSQTFSFQPRPDGGDLSAVFQVAGTLTTLACSLQQALDGVNFADYIIAGSFLTPSATVIKVTPVVAGVPYRINYATASGSINTYVAAN